MSPAVVRRLGCRSSCWRDVVLVHRVLCQRTSVPGVMIRLPVRRLRQKPLGERLVVTGRSCRHDLATVEEMCDRVIVLAW